MKSSTPGLARNDVHSTVVIFRHSAHTPTEGLPDHSATKKKESNEGEEKQVQGVSQVRVLVTVIFLLYSPAPKMVFKR